MCWRRECSIKLKPQLEWFCPIGPHPPPQPSLSQILGRPVLAPRPCIQCPWSSESFSSPLFGVSTAPSTSPSYSVTFWFVSYPAWNHKQVSWSFAKLFRCTWMSLMCYICTITPLSCMNKLYFPSSHHLQSVKTPLVRNRFIRLSHCVVLLRWPYGFGVSSWIQLILWSVLAVTT